jgi:hypothetical protein
VEENGVPEENQPKKNEMCLKDWYPYKNPTKHVDLVDIIIIIIISLKCNLFLP